MATRLSIEEQKLGAHEDGAPEPPGVDSPDTGSALYNRYCVLYDRFHKLYAVYDEKEWPYPDWIRPAAELIESIRTISRDCVLYQLCFIVLDGVSAIVRLAEEVAADSMNADVTQDSDVKELVKAKEMMLRAALTGISNLMEHMIRMEGELVHHPETRPLLYDIPANLLELYLHFSDMCLMYYQRRERQNADEHFQLLLLPCLCETITVSAVNGRNSEDTDFLYVEVPLHVLYDSRYAICSLVHEVAHYGGEETRQREIRYQALACSVFFQALSTFRVALPKGNRLKQLIPLCRAFADDIPEDSREYMKDLRPALGEVMKNRLLCYPFKGKFTIDEHTGETVELIIDELVELYREAYADLAMVSLLALKPETYIDVLKRNYESLGNVAKAYTVERGALVVKTIWPEARQRRIPPHKGLYTDIAVYLKCLDDESNLTDVQGGYHNREAVSFIYTYLRTCYEKMKEFDIKKENAGKIVDIRKCFQDFAVDQKFASSEFYKELEAHREKLMESKLD